MGIENRYRNKGLEPGKELGIGVRGWVNGGEDAGPGGRACQCRGGGFLCARYPCMPALELVPGVRRLGLEFGRVGDRVRR